MTGCGSACGELSRRRKHELHGGSRPVADIQPGAYDGWKETFDAFPRLSVMMLTALLIVAYPVLNFVYWPEVLKSGVLPPDGDSIGIPMFGSLLVTLIASPIVMGMAWMCYRRYNPSTRFLVFRLDRPWRSAVATAIFGISAAIICFVALSDATRAMPWYEYLWSAYMVLTSAWLLTLRASFIEQYTVKEAEAEPR